MISHSHNHNHHSCGEKMLKCQEYVEALEEERRKIQVFQRELPLCLELVTQAIEACKQQLSGTTTDYFNGQSECSEQISSEGPAFEQFIPIKRDYSDDDDDNDEEEQSHEPKINNTNNNNDNNTDKCSNKSDWLRSVQLWNQTPDPPTKEDSPRKGLKRNGGGGAFHPFKREKSVGTTTTTIRDNSPSLVLAASASSSGCSGGGSGGSRKEEKEEHSQRKMRRCWSPELHRQFLHALQQLGGSHVATPKQIRELMKVDGLTNDEVKSHLQKYRLNTRRPPSFHSNTNSQAPQIVVVGGIWVPPPEYSAVATTTATTAAGGEATGVATPKGIYAPIAAPPPGPPRLPQTAASQTQRQQSKQSKQLHTDERPNHSEDGVHSSSPATSSSTHTTTASPAF